MVQFWACMVKGLSCMQIFMLKIIVGPAISFASSLLLVPSVSPRDCMAHASSTFLRVTRDLQQIALGLPVLMELAICLWFVLLVCWWHLLSSVILGTCSHWVPEITDGLFL
jgi:hypothetical protein